MSNTGMPDWIEEAIRRADEPLDPELANYLQEVPGIGTVLRHPLVYMVPFFQPHAFIANETLNQKLYAVNKASLEDEWYTYIFLHERPYRYSALLEIRNDITDAQYWTLLSDVWTDSENHYQWGSALQKLLLSKRPGRAEHFMNPEERETLAVYGDTIKIWRGYNNPAARLGWSWTTNIIIARFFARRYANKGDAKTIITATVPKSKVLGLMLGRDEYEIIADPRNVTILQEEEL